MTYKTLYIWMTGNYRRCSVMVLDLRPVLVHTAMIIKMGFKFNVCSVYYIIMLCLLQYTDLINADKIKSKTFKPSQEDAESSQQPNIIFIFADDLGHADVGFNGNKYGAKIKTPNLDRLARKGVILSNYYVQNLCSPSRSQLMTGRYQIHTGLINSNIHAIRPMCLPEDEITLPQKLKEAGYVTHMVGKWHLGHQREECLPTYRGFDSFVGMYLGSGDYFTHMKKFSFSKPPHVINAYDFHRDIKENRTVGYKYYGEYSTHVFAHRAQKIIKTHKGNKPLFMYVSFQAPHGPLQVPGRYRLPFDNTTMDYDRKILAAMIYSMDEAIGNIVTELKRARMYQNTVIIFSSDNGGPRDLPASNWPFRGAKGSFFEGGVRAVGFIHTPLFPKVLRGTVSDAFIHVSDWFPTIIQGLAGGNLKGTKPLDGYDIWETIRTGGPSPRKEILFNINSLEGDFPHRGPQFHPSMPAALRLKHWKIITGYKGNHRWQAPPESKYSDIIRSESPNKHIWLFNITADPYEFHDLSEQYPDVVNLMLKKLQKYMDNMASPIWPSKDLAYDPANYGGVWGPWTISPSPIKETVKAERIPSATVATGIEQKENQETNEEENSEMEKKKKQDKRQKKEEKVERLRNENKQQKMKEKERKQHEKQLNINMKKEELKLARLEELKSKRREAIKEASFIIPVEHTTRAKDKLDKLRRAQTSRNRKLKKQRAQIARNKRQKAKLAESARKKKLKQQKAEIVRKKKQKAEIARKKKQKAKDE